ncbi:MAG: ABC transporter ATP-binding protein [Thermodesulfobacteriota bacterium]
MTETRIMEARGVSFSYGSRSVLADLDLEVRPGCFYGLVGPNGSGKTTLLDLLLGVRRPEAGEVFFLTRPVAGFGRRELARHVALAPQEFAINFPFTVEEVVFMGRHPFVGRFGTPSRRDLDLVAWAMHALGLANLKHKPVTELSSGEKQRAVLARTLAQDTPVVVLDEPTSNLDIRHALEVLRTVKDLVEAKGRTAVAVMHDLNLAASFCHELVYLKDGRVFVSGPVREVLTEENIAAVFGVVSKVHREPASGSPWVVFNQGGRA